MARALPNEEARAIQRQIGMWPVFAPPAIMAGCLVVEIAFSKYLTAWTLLPIQLGLLAVVAVSQARHARRLRAKVVGAAGRVCIHCAYSLAGLPAPGSCPECGRAYPGDAYASAWLREWPQALGKYSNFK